MVVPLKFLLVIYKTVLINLLQVYNHDQEDQIITYQRYDKLNTVLS